MTPEEKQMLTELYEWMQQRKVQQLSYPVDDASRGAMRALTASSGTSSALTQEYTDNGGDKVIAPKAYAGTTFVSVDGVIREIPYL